MVLYTRINQAHRRLKDYLTNTSRTWAPAKPASSARSRSPTSPRSSAFTSRCRFTRGGLGVLSGDHIKSASGLGVPLVAMGLFYDQGYFKQHLDDKWLPARRVSRHAALRTCRWSPAKDPNGKPITISIETRGGTLLAKVWLMHVGRV